MSHADSLAFAWAVVLGLVSVIGFVAVLLLGLSIVGEVRK